MSARADAPGEGGRLAAAAALVALATLAIWVQAAPIDLGPAARTRPDMVFAALAWAALARPDAAPAGLTFAIALVADLAVGGPAGATGLGLFLAAEGLKRRARYAETRPLAVDAFAVAVAAAGALLVPWALMAVTFAGGPPLVALAPVWLATVLATGALAAACRWGLRIRPLPPARPDGAGAFA